MPKDSVEGLKKGQARVVDWKGERVGVYRDDDDELYTVRAICTHLAVPWSGTPRKRRGIAPATAPATTSAGIS